jgi:hypothetical protein
MLLGTAKVIFEAHASLKSRAPVKCPIDAQSTPQCGTSLGTMRNQTSEAFAYIEREYKEAKDRVELQRRVVAQLRVVEADASEAEAFLSALLHEEASKLRILDYLRRWSGRVAAEMPANRA